MARLKRRPPTENPPIGSFRRRALLSRSEAEFYVLLDLAFRDELGIFPKMNLNDVVACTHPGDRWRIAQKHIDFVLVNPSDLSVVAAIELDDPTHEHPVNALHDQAKDHFLGEADIPVVRIWLDDARRFPPEELRRRILSVQAERVPYPGRTALPPWAAWLALATAGTLLAWMLWRLIRGG